MSFVIPEARYEHHDWAIPETGDAGIVGYLQSEKYWQDLPEFPVAFTRAFMHAVNRRWGDLLRGPTLGIHVRRCDYVGNPNYFNLAPDYFVSAVEEHFPDWRKRRIFVFSDDPAYCRMTLSFGPNMIVPEDLHPVAALALMSRMRGLVISNSTFGWWGARLAEAAGNRGIRVVRPSGHFDGGLARSQDSRDLYPDRWIVHPAA